MDYGEAMVDKAMYNVAKLRIYGACSIHLVRSCQICCLVINKKQHENFRIVAQTLILMLFCIDTRAKSLIPAFRTLYEGPVFDVLSNRFISFENLVKVKKWKKSLPQGNCWQPNLSLCSWFLLLGVRVWKSQVGVAAWFPYFIVIAFSKI